jgi:phytoene dehydrogenase-like protein
LSSDGNTPVLIVGAGLAGLACALELQRRGIPFRIFEASDGVGGRVQTDIVEGFRLDRGFQVYLTAYPEGQRVLDYDSLRFQRFLPGAMVRFGHRFHRVMDPWREPFAALQSLLNPVGSVVDKLRVARLRAASMAGTVEQVLARPGTTTRKALEQYGFSPNMIERFFSPFFGGILLDRELSVTSRMLEFVFRMMAMGDTVLPEKGMGEIPRQMAGKLCAGCIEFGRRVREVNAKRIRFEDGRDVVGRAVVVAVEGPEAARLVPEFAPVHSRAVCCLYFASAGEPPLPEPIVVLDGNGEGLVHNFSVPSQVSRAYAPEGQNLMSATVLGNPDVDDAALEQRVRAQLRGWFGASIDTWRLLRIYRIRHGHPILENEGPAEKSVRAENGVFVCGDHRFLPSIHAALVNGRHAAEALAAEIAGQAEAQKSHERVRRENLAL